MVLVRESGDWWGQEKNDSLGGEWLIQSEKRTTIASCVSYLLTYDSAHCRDT